MMGPDLMSIAVQPSPDLSGRPVAAADARVFVETYGQLFEHSPWVVERAWAKRPFADAEALLASFGEVLDEALPEKRLALVRAHPELADKLAIAKGLTESSAGEQAGAGLDRLSPAEFETFSALNRAYRERFGFPFVICVRLNDKASILAAMRERLGHGQDGELAAALVQIGLIARLRLADIRVRP